MVVPPLVAATLVVALGIMVSMMTGVSPLHLVRWFPGRCIIGLVALIFPLGTHLFLRFRVLFVGPMKSSVQLQPQGTWESVKGRENLVALPVHCAEPRRAADCLQPALVPRSSFRQQLTPSVRRFIFDLRGTT